MYFYNFYSTLLKLHFQTVPTKIVSFPILGFFGIKNDKEKDNTAIQEPIINTQNDDFNHSNPNIKGKNTAAIWLMVKLTADAEAMSLGFAIFWKYVFRAIAIEKSKWSSTNKNKAI